MEPGEAFADPVGALVGDVENAYGSSFSSMRWWIARATTSRGASSAAGWTSCRNGLPEASVIFAPSPRRASVRSRRPFGCSERRRVELDVLEVQEPRAGAPRHREAVAARAGGIRRVEIDLAEAAGREDRLAGDVRRHGAGLPLQDVRADDDRRVVAVGRIDGVVRQRQEVDGRRLEAPADVLLAPAGVDERPLDRRAGFVLDVEDARHRVRALERPVEPAAFPVEGDLELLDEELLDEVGALAGDQGYGLGGAEAVARALDVRGEHSRACRRGAGRRCRPARRTCSTRAPHRCGSRS